MPRQQAFKMNLNPILIYYTNKLMISEQQRSKLFYFFSIKLYFFVTYNKIYALIYQDSVDI